jgi:hypothetical protein
MYLKLTPTLAISSFCQTVRDTSCNQLSMDSCDENAVAVAHTQHARTNENSVALKITAFSHSPVQSITGCTLNVRTAEAVDSAVPVNYSSLLSFSESCDIPSPPKS